MIASKSSLALLVVLATAAMAPAAENAPVPGTLIRYIPADSWVAVGNIATPERQFVCAHWARVQRALATCGFDREIRAGILAALPECDRPAFEETWDTLVNAVRRVHWSDLVHQEFVFAERFNGIFPDIWLGFRPAADTRDENVAALADGLRTLASFDKSGDIAFSETTTKGVRVWALDVRNAPVGVCLLHKDDIVMIVLGQTGRSDAIGLLSGQGAVAAMADAPRFRSAMAEVPPAEHSYAFMDLDRLFKVLPLLPKMVAGQKLAASAHAEADGATAEASATVESATHVDAWLTLFSDVMSNLDIFDYVVMSSAMDGNQEITHKVSRTKPSAHDKPLYRMAADRKPIESFERYVPVEATSLQVSTTVDLQILYDFVFGLIRDRVPGGAAVCARWEELQTEWDFHVQEDVFSWLSGELISMGLPRAAPSPFGNEDAVMLIRVRDAAKARAKIAAGLKRTAAFTQSRGQPIQLLPASGLPVEGFQRVEFGMLAVMAIHPCVGVWEDWLVIGTNESAIQAMLETAAGKHDNILKNAQFRAEGILPDGPVQLLSFTDMSRLGESLTSAFIGMGFAAGTIPDTPESRPVRTMIRALGSLAPVVNEINFFKSTCTAATFEDGVWRSTTKITYRGAPAPAANEN